MFFSNSMTHGSAWLSCEGFGLREGIVFTLLGSKSCFTVKLSTTQEAERQRSTQHSTNASTANLVQPILKGKSAWLCYVKGEWLKTCTGLVLKMGSKLRNNTGNTCVKLSTSKTIPMNNWVHNLFTTTGFTTSASKLFPTDTKVLLNYCKTRCFP